MINNQKREMNSQQQQQQQEQQLSRDLIDSSELVMLNNKDFFSDDIYDFKETFMNHNGKQSGKANGNVRPVNGDVYNMYDLEDDDFGDDLAGLAQRSHNNQNNLASRGDFDLDEDEDENNDFRVKSNDDDDDNYLGDNFNHIGDMGGGGGGGGDTFFKRVDSMELVKPKKAKIINNYLIGELLGDGSYGKVKECLDLDSLARRAVKIINLKMVNRKIPRGIENVRKEIRIMKRLDHKNVIKMYGTFEKGNLDSVTIKPNNSNKNFNAADVTTTTALTTTPDLGAKSQSECNDELLRQSGAMVTLEKPPKLYIFMDYCISSLEKLLKSAPDSRLRNYQANFYFKQLVDGLEYLHSLNIVHNDIKPGNLLITCDDVLKICDFSISADLGVFSLSDYANSRRQQQDDSTEQDTSTGSNDYVNPNLLWGASNSGKFPITNCTPMFQCPEMLDESMDEMLILKQAHKIDIWSSGITLYQLTTGDLPFKGQTLHQIYETIRSSSIDRVTMPDYLDRDLVELLRGMLIRDPVSRYGLKQIRDTKWYRRKHPVIKEELAALPADVVQNELNATSRMLNYLNKYCQPLNERTSALVSAAFNQDETQSQRQMSISTSQQPIGPSSSQTASAAAAADPPMSSKLTNVNQPASSAPSNAKKYNQATKIKRNRCDLM